MQETYNPIAQAECGKSRKEFYAVGKLEYFGLNKRTRRKKNSKWKNVLTTPEGKVING